VKAIKLLQFGTVIEVMVLLIVGLVVLFVFPGKTESYRVMVQTLAPFLTLQIGASFGGPPLKRVLENSRAKINNGNAG